MPFLIVLCLFLGSSNLMGQEFKGLPKGDEKIASSNENFEQAVLRLVNEERRKRRRAPLVWNENLAYAARYHAKDMAADNYFSHDSKDQTRWGNHKKIGDVSDRVNKFIDPNKIFARSENIAVGQRSPEEVVRNWMSSPSHKRNILDKEAKYLGVAYIVVPNSEWVHYWVQDFGL